MTTAQLPKVNSDSGGFDDIKGLTDILNSMFGGATTSTGKSESPDSASMGQADALLKKIMGDSNPADIDAMVGNILDRAKQSFGPAAISANAAGVRAYSDSSLASMRNEAMARATGEAAAAKLNAMNAANSQATQLVSAKLKASTASTQKQKTSGSPGGQAIGIAALGMQGYNLLKKKGVIDKVTAGMSGTPDATVGDFTGGGGGGFEGVDFSSDAAFSSPASDTSSTGIDGLLDFAKTPPVDAPVEAAATPSGDAPVTADSTGVVADSATTAATTGEVVTGGYAMPPAQTVDPLTGLPNSMPAAVADAEAIDAIPADTGGDVGDLSANVDLGDAAFDPGMEAVGSVAGEGIGDLYFPGAFTVANLATEGQLGEAVGGGIDAVGEGLASTAGGVEDILGDAGNFIGDTVDWGVSAAENLFSDLGDSLGCFMTTAATLGGELDNGISLKTMRDFRSSYMQETPDRLAEIAEYYILAPFIVKRINESSNSNLLWKKIREDYLTPAVLAYHGGFPEVTHEIYKDMMYFARQQVGLANPEGVH